MKVLKLFLVCGFVACIGLMSSTAQVEKETTCITVPAWGYLDCVDEAVVGEMTYCGSFWTQDGENWKWQGRWDATFKGEVSGAIYTFTRTDNFKTHNWDGVVSHWSMVRTALVYRDGQLIGEWHINTKDLWNVNQPGQLVDLTNEHFECY